MLLMISYGVLTFFLRKFYNFDYHIHKNTMFLFFSTEVVLYLAQIINFNLAETFGEAYYYIIFYTGNRLIL